MEGFLEESRIKLSGQVSDLFGMSGTRMLRALTGADAYISTPSCLRVTLCKHPAHIFSDQYRQLVRSAPAGAVFRMRSIICGTYI
jgi:hypothetical protein